VRFQKIGVELGLGPSFWECPRPHPGGLSYTKL